MEWLQVLLFNQESISSSILILALVSFFGILLGSIPIKGVKLGVGGVVFSGIFFANVGLGVNHTVLEFAREFGLILFVYVVGLHVGPGFVQSLKAQGMKLNICATAIVILGALTTVFMSYVLNIEPATAIGIFSGATTNTPSLAASTQAISDKVRLLYGGAPEMLELTKMPSVGYAVAYPLGVLGIILSMVALRIFFRINNEQEKTNEEKELGERPLPLQIINIKVDNKNLAGRMIKDIPGISAMHVVISRILQSGQLRTPTPETVLALGDVFLAVGPDRELEQLQLIVGERVDLNLKELPGEITSRTLIVTNKSVVGKRVQDINELRELGVTVTRIRRADFELSPGPRVYLNYADALLVVGSDKSVDKAVSVIGDSYRQLDHPDIIVLFLGIIFGVILGSVPIWFPGASSPVKLGMAGGPLLVAIMLSRFNKIGSSVAYMPQSAKIVLREVGITLFLACVGLKSGQAFIDSLLHGDGLVWMFAGVVVTLLPIFAVGIFARYYWKLSFGSLLGLIAGATTDPPALAYAQSSYNSDTCLLGYATVYPLTMMLRIIAAQVLVLAML